MVRNQLNRIRRRMSEGVWRVVAAMMFIAGWGVRADGAAPTGAWRGSLDLGVAKLPLVFNFSGSGCTLDSPQQGARGIAAEVVFSDGDSLAVDVRSLGASFRGRVGESEIAGVFSQSGRSFPLVLNRELPVGERRPQTPRGPFPYASRDTVFVSADGVRLAGTVAIPAGGFRCGTPMVVMVTGSGPQNRDEEIFEHKPFAVIADFLARRGIASFRYDDRGTGMSEGVFASSDIDDFTNDAEAALAFARSLNPDGRTGILGHSEGGTIALLLGSKGLPDFVVSMAGLAVRGRDLVLEQNRHSLSRQPGLSEAQKECVMTLLNYVFASMESGVLPDDIDVEGYVAEAGLDIPGAVVAQIKGSVRQSQGGYFRKFLALNPSLWLGKIDSPVFALNGSLDTQVGATANLSVIKESVDGCHVKEYAGLNHLFQHAVTGEVAEYGDIAETISEEVLEDIVGFVLRSGGSLGGS